MPINVNINFKDNFSAYILMWMPPCGKIADCQQISLERSILEHPCFIQEGLNNKKIQLNLCNIFFILLLNELYLFV